MTRTTKNATTLIVDVQFVPLLPKHSRETQNERDTDPWPGLLFDTVMTVLNSPKLLTRPAIIVAATDGTRSGSAIQKNLPIWPVLLSCVVLPHTDGTPRRLVRQTTT